MYDQMDEVHEPLFVKISFLNSGIDEGDGVSYSVVVEFTQGLQLDQVVSILALAAQQLMSDLVPAPKRHWWNRRRHGP